MVENACPHCGKPLRPGSRFCGNCGNSVDLPAKRSDADTAGMVRKGSATDAASIEESSAGWTPCPHCGNPFRPGAKFCNNCGKELPAETAAAADLAGKPPSPVAPVGMAESSTLDKTSLPSSQKPRKRRSIIPLLTIGVLLACTAIITGGYIYLRDPFNLFSGGIRAKTTLTATTAPTTVATQQPTQAVNAVKPITTSLPTAAKATSTPTVPPSETPVQASQSIQTDILLADDFDTPLKDNWIVWVAEGSSHRPKIDQGPGENFLFLSSDEKPGEAGITTKTPITLTAGLEIQFIGQLFDDLPGFVLILDWDPSDVERGPNSTESGDIHLEIWKDQLVFTTVTSGEQPCQKVNEGIQEHSYRILVPEETSVELYVDGATEPICKLTLPELGARPGTITFTGIGWITKVQVAAPVETQ